MRPVVVCAVGTRPEVVKMAPLIARLRREESRLAVRILATGQHRGLLDRALGDFALVADDDLDLMRPDQGLADLSARGIAAVGAYLSRTDPALVLAQGDTTTVLATALACYYHRTAFGHVEAGLRTGLAYDPFPEEKNRVLASHLAEVHFAPTPRARTNLLREGIAADAIHVTGNTVIDALANLAKETQPRPATEAGGRFLLVTLHRRENFGAPLERVCQALRALVDQDPALEIVFPVHPNPRVHGPVFARLGGHERIRLIEPVGYPRFVALLKAAALVLTDSGGVQEEAPALGKRVLVLREATERPEGVEAGHARLVGTDGAAIVAEARRWLAEPLLDAEVPATLAATPYGDGWAAERIARVVLQRFGHDPGPLPPECPRFWPPGGDLPANAGELLGGTAGPA